MAGLQHQNTFSRLPLTDSSTLFVFALASEAAGEFDDVPKLVCGIGKISAAYQITKAIHIHKPSLIINLGSAGSNVFSNGEVVCCTQFVQRDMNVCAMGYASYETPLSGIDPVLNYGITINGLPNGICGTGDSFEVSHSCADYNVLDMEAYALALVAMKEQIPFLCLKYISDGADDSAPETWALQVHKAAEAFKAILFAVE